MTSRPLLAATTLGAISVVAFVGVLQAGFDPAHQWPAEQRLFVYLFSPCLLLAISFAGAAMARWLELPKPRLIGALLPLGLVVAALATGQLLSSLQINPVHGVDGFAGWMLVAIAAYPAVAVWLLPQNGRRRVVVTATALAMFAGMLGYSWLARERWRYDYYTADIRQDVVSVFEVPGFHVEGLRHLDNRDSPLTNASLRYVLAGDDGGPYQGLKLRVDATPGPKRVGEQVSLTTARIEPLVHQCVGGTDLVASGRFVCGSDMSAYAQLFIDGAVFLVRGVGPQLDRGTARAIASGAKVKQWSRSDLRYIPVS